MPLVYFDSDALVKLVVEEAGSDLAAALWDGCDAAPASRLAYPEVRAALAASGRTRDLDTDERAAAEAAFEGYWAGTRPVELTRKVERHAGRIASLHSIGGATRSTLRAPWRLATPSTSLPSGTSGFMPAPRQQAFILPPSS